MKTPAAPTAKAVVATRAITHIDTETKAITRREFLNYIWGASMALLLAESTGGIIWFMLPRFRAGEFGGVFTLDPGKLPPIKAPPALVADGGFWLSNVEKGLLALSVVCVHLGCLFKWVDVNHRFECPCHGSKYQADGTYISGPAGRSLDRFVISVTTPTSLIKTPPSGDPVTVQGATSISVDTGSKILGHPHA